MTIADRIEDHQARCQPHVLKLRMIASDETANELPWEVVLEVIEATEAILAEAGAAVRDARSGGGPEAGNFLSVRLSRLTVAASDAVAAAGTGEAGQLRRALHRFDVLTSAMWTVQQAVCSPRHRMLAAQPQP